MSNETNNLGRTQLSQSQAENRYLTVNNSDGAIDAAVTAHLDLAVTNGVNTIAIATQSGRASNFNLINAGSPPSAGFTVRFSTTDRGIIYIKNDTSYTATIDVSGQVGPPTLTAGSSGIFLVRSNGVTKLTTGAGAAAWGSITGTLSAQTDLQTALDGKVNDTGDTMTGGLTVPAGNLTTGGISLGSSSAAQIAQGLDSSNAAAAHVGVMALAVADLHRYTIAGATPSVQANSTSGTANISSVRWNATAANGGRLTIGHSAGASIGTFTSLSNGDNLGGITFAGSDGTNLIASARLMATVSGTPATGVLPSRAFIETMNAAGSITERIGFEADGSITVGGSSNTVIDGNRILRPRSYTKATLPAATATGVIYCADEDGGGCNLYSDGTNWRRNWDGKISGTTNKKKQTIWVPAAAIKPRTSNGCANVATAETTTNKVNYDYLAFDPSTVEYAQFNVRMPKSWDESTITYMARWTHPAATAFNVVWGLQAIAVSDGDAMDAAFGTAVTVTDSGGTTQTSYATAESGAVTIAGSPAAQDMVTFQLYRDATNGSDTLDVDAHLIGLTIFFNTDDDTDA